MCDKQAIDLLLKEGVIKLEGAEYIETDSFKARWLGISKEIVSKQAKIAQAVLDCPFPSETCETFNPIDNNCEQRSAVNSVTRNGPVVALLSICCAACWLVSGA